MAGLSRDPASAARFGLIGCGAVGSLLDEDRPTGPALTHAAALTRSDRAELVAVCDVDEKRAQRCAEKRGVEGVYRDPLRMLADERLDGIVLATPPIGRVPIVRAAVAAGVRLIWCEKPLATTVVDAQAVAAEVPEHVIFAVNYLRRWAPLADDLREAVNGTLGEIQSVDARYTKGLLNNGGHLLDVLGMLFGRPATVRAIGVVDDGRDADPTVESLLSFEVDGRSIGAALLGSDYRNYQVFELDLLGRRGRLRMLDGGRYVERQDAHDDPDFPGYRNLDRPRRSDGGVTRAMEAALRQLLDVLDGSAPAPRCTLADGLAAVETAEAVLRSMAEGGRQIRL